MLASTCAIDRVKRDVAEAFDLTKATPVRRWMHRNERIRWEAR